MLSKYNRNKSKTAKKEFFYCRCDLNKIGQYGKCSICNRKNNKKKIKIPPID